MNIRKVLYLSACAVALSFASPATAPQAHAEQAAMNKDIVEVAASNEQFSTLVSAIEAADLVGTLKSDGPITVFAPTNAAFDKLPPGQLASLMKPENKNQLRSVLGYHVVGGKLIASSIDDGRYAVPTATGAKIELSKNSAGVMVEDAKVINADMTTSNGVIHVVDTVIIPQ